ncbi:hypothetical protein GALMADRAFT_72334 [Galerina marginata CBS 339.88]|uniref:Terpene synthase n=1 Tax=Galerina marginata (strain CBS 339.88) TaxID=685588 RepID=A0A067STW7_GALM3|nr:hypothetical protein GALMADRAFT_72334 [Galerina marginata CBS 339.88]
MPAPLQLTLPDILANFPWARNLSEYYYEAKAESIAWAESYQPLDETGLMAFNLCDFTIVRLCCDLMNLLFLYDDYTDIADGDKANKIRDTVMDAFRNPHKERLAGDLILGAMARDFWIRASSYVSPGAACLDHFIDSLDDYTAAVVKEADDRANRRYRSFEDFMLIRRDSSGCFPSIVLCEFGLDIPEEIFHHPRITAIREQGTDLLTIINDIYSFNLEKSRGLELHNSVELVMVEQNLEVQGAVKWLEQYGEGVLAAFLDNVANMPSWDIETDQSVKIFIDGIAQWVRANDDWSFESARYFGNKGLEIKKTRALTLHLPN